jgi:hypothetical protein
MVPFCIVAAIYPIHPVGQFIGFGAPHAKKVQLR